MSFNSKNFFHKKFVGSYRTFTLLAIVGLLLFNANSAFAIVYQPGETLDPTCLPTDVNCYVQPPITGITATSTFQTAIVANAGIQLASSTPTTTASTLYALGGALYWNGTQLGISATGTQGYIMTFDASGSQVATSTLFVSSNGWVGVGTTTPGAKFAVAGNIFGSGLLTVTGTSTLATTTATGLALSQNGLTLSSSTPATIASTLYNLGSTLYWNGSAIGLASAGPDWTYFNGGGVRLSTTTNSVLIGAFATSSNAKFEVFGSSYLGGILTVTGTSTLATTTLAQATVMGGISAASSTITGTSTAQGLTATFANIVTSVFDTLTSRAATIYNGTFGNLTATSTANLATTTITFLTASSTSISGTFAVTGTSTLANVFAQNATTTSLFANSISAFSGMFGTLTATSSATLGTTTVNGQLSASNIISTSSATSTFAGLVTTSGNVSVGTTSNPERLNVDGVLALAEQAGNFVVSATNSFGKLFTKTATGDGNDIYTKLLTHANGSNGSTSFGDSSSVGHPITSNSSAAISTATIKFGTGAISLNGTSQYLTVPTSVDFDMANSASWTFDTWVNPTSVTGTRVIVENSGNANNRWTVYLNAGTPVWEFNIGAGGPDVQITSTGGAISIGVWTHIAVTRVWTGATYTYTLYVNGVSQGTTSNVTAQTAFNSNSLAIGASIRSGAINFFAGFIDELRISQNVSRYGAGFTPPTAPYGSGLYYVTSTGAEIELGNQGSASVGSGAALSALVSANKANTIDNANYAQNWNWSTATSTNALVLGANSLTTGSLFSLDTSSASTSALALNIGGAVAFKKGNDFATTTTIANDVDFGNASLVRVNQASGPVTITGIAGGTDGKLLTLINASSTSSVTLANATTSSLVANRIITGTGGDLQLAGDASALLVYDSGVSRWRVIGGSGSGSNQTTLSTVIASTTLGNFGITNKLDATAGNLIITLPTAVGNAGKLIELIKTDNTANSVQVIGTSGQTIAGNTYLYLYSQNDAVTLRSDGSNYQIVSDNRSSVGQSKSYINATRTTNQTTGLTGGSPVVFTSVGNSYGSDISLNTTTGIFTLQAGKTYKLTGTVPYIVTNGGAVQASFVWRDLTGNVLVGSGTHAVAAASGNADAQNGGPAVAIVTPTIATQVQLEIRGNTSSFGQIGGGSDVTDIARFMPDAYIEVISTPQNVINTMEYVSGKLTTSQSTNITDGVDHIKFDTVLAGNIPVDIATAYTSTPGVPSIGRISLTAGKTYELVGTIGELGLPNTATGVRFQWYDVTTGTAVALGKGSNLMAPGYTGSALQADNIAYAIFTPAVSSRVELRQVAGQTLTVISFGSSFAVKQIGSTAATGLVFNNILGALAAGSLDNTTFAQQWNWSTATSTTALALSANALTTGSLLSLDTSSASSTAFALKVNGSTALQYGTDFATTSPYAVNVDFGNTSSVRVNAASSAFVGITGIAGGGNGRLLTLVNASSTASFTLYNQATTSSLATNRIITGTGGDITIASDASVLLSYDPTTLRWRVIGGSGSGGSSQTTFTTQTSSATLTSSAFSTTQKLDATSGNLVITLPSPTSQSGKSIEFIKTDNTSNSVRIIPNASEQIASTTALYLYSQNDAVTVRSDGTNWQIVSDNRSSVGQSKSYMDATRTANQTTGLSSGNPVVFTSVNNSNGSDISLNTSTGIFTLQAGKTYRLTGTVPYIVNSLAASQASFVWRDLTNNALLGSGTHSTAAGAGNLDAQNGGPAVAIITAMATIQVQLEIRGAISNLSAIGGSPDVADMSRFMPDAYIEVISTPQNVINTVEYLQVHRITSNQTITGGSNLVFNSNDAGNMSYDTTTGIATLTAGKTYHIRVSAHFNVGTAFLNQFALFDTDTSTEISGTRAEMLSPSSATMQMSSGMIDYTITPTATKHIAARFINSGTGAGENMRSDLYSGMYIQQVGSTAATGLPFNYIGAATAAGLLDNTNFAQQWNWSTATTTTALALNANALTTGGLLSLTSSSGSLNSSNGLLYVANTGTSTSGTLASFVASITASAGLYINNNGFVGISTSTPNAAFVINSASTTQNIFQIATSTNQNILVVNNNGLLGIGTSTPTASLVVNGVSGRNLLQLATSTNQNIFVVNQAGFVGIGTSTPSNALTIQTSVGGGGIKLEGPTNVRIIAQADNTIDNAELNLITRGGQNYSAIYNAVSDGSLRFFLNGDKVIIASSTGNVGIGTGVPANKLNVLSSTANDFTARFENTANAPLASVLRVIGGQNSFSSASNLIFFERPDGTNLGNVAQNSSTGVAYNNTSDARIKENIATTTLSLNALMGLQVSDFDFINDPSHKKTTGFIAQNVYKIFPDAVTTNGDDGLVKLDASSTPWQVDYGRITPLIVKAVQDLSSKVDANASSTASSTLAFASTTISLTDLVSSSVASTSASVLTLNADIASATGIIADLKTKGLGVDNAIAVLTTQSNAVGTTLNTLSSNTDATTFALFGTTTPGLMFATDATTTATQTFEGSWFAQIIRSFLGSISNGIDTVVANVFKAKEIETTQLCIGDASGQKTCLDKSQIDSILKSALSTTTPAAVNSIGESQTGASSNTTVNSPETPDETSATTTTESSAVSTTTPETVSDEPEITAPIVLAPQTEPNTNSIAESAPPSAVEPSPTSEPPIKAVTE